MAKRPGRVMYEANLGNKSYIEQVHRIGEMSRCGGFVLMRFGRPVTRFKASPAQAKKIASGRGRLRITEKMVRDYNICASYWGR